MICVKLACKLAMCDSYVKVGINYLRYPNSDHRPLLGYFMSTTYIANLKQSDKHEHRSVLSFGHASLEVFANTDPISHVSPLFQIRYPIDRFSMIKRGLRVSRIIERRLLR